MARARRKRKRSHKQSLKELFSLLAKLSHEHGLFTYAAVIAFQALVAVIALVLLTLAVLGEIGRSDVWDKQIGPQIAPKVLPDVYAGLDATAQKIFHSSSGGLIAFATVVTVWQMSGVVRVCMSALGRIYDEDDTRPWRTRVAISLAVGVALTAGLVGGALLATAARTAVHGSWGIP